VVHRPNVHPEGRADRRNPFLRRRPYKQRFLRVKNVPNLVSRLDEWQPLGLLLLAGATSLGAKTGTLCQVLVDTGGETAQVRSSYARLPSFSSGAS
jgi:hypothetical protein